MHAKDILIDGYDRIRDVVHSTVDGLDADTLNARPALEANSISWLVWHLTRVQDDHVADAFGLDAAREPDGFAKAALRLSEYRKLEPGALEEFVFFDHPSGRTRIRMAMQWKKDHVPGATMAKPELVPPM